MPQFNIHSPKTQDMITIREASRKKIFPIGLICENHNFAYGYNGESYYVTESVFGYLVTRMQLDFEEAKQLFNALTFAEASEPKASDINNLVKSSRKEGLSGDNLFWFYVDTLSK